MKIQKYVKIAAKVAALYVVAKKSGIFEDAKEVREEIAPFLEKVQSLKK